MVIFLVPFGLDPSQSDFNKGYIGFGMFGDSNNQGRALRYGPKTNYHLD